MPNTVATRKRGVMSHLGRTQSLWRLPNSASGQTGRISFGKSPNAPIIDLHTGHLAKNLNRTIEIGNGADLGKIVVKSDFSGPTSSKAGSAFSAGETD
jgi:hypothetical protein